ncbi:hypothetical protein [Paenibacillus sp. NEAU-GSW1]|uniref:hypothetical protein n=1 Tax=Paenibacillus sp. NEAU-GSW1 TaxID=2682486 RepID=UPI0012E0EC13|nr:hypothetical protein [Paenibacillus sp. NEAU-GSW1]MUT66014.1 hypothetical protein [Paenibacillus sp. NEAU-GSW1]
MLEIVREDYHFDTVVMSRNHLENRGFFPYPCQVEDWLKEHDTDLEVWKNARTNKYRIVGVDYWTIMEIDAWQLSYGIVEHIKRIDSRRGYRAINELNAADERHDRNQQNLLEDIGYNLAKDTRKMVSTMH